MAYRGLALAVVAVHVGFLAYVILGGFLAWRWPRLILPHVLAIGWAASSVSTRLPCPLTGLQNWARARGGLPTLPAGFIDSYVRGTFYPADHERLAQVLVGLIVAVSWLGYARRTATRRRTAGSTGWSVVRR